MACDAAGLGTTGIVSSVEPAGKVELVGLGSWASVASVADRATMTEDPGVEIGVSVRCAGVEVVRAFNEGERY